MPVARLREDQQRCDVCGSTAGLCACTAATSELTARAAELSSAAMSAVSAGELHRAIRIGRQALAIDGSTAQLWYMVGLSEVAVGNIGNAVAALRVAHSLDRESGAGEWVQSLERGPARDSLLRYNSALADANAGRVEQAASVAESVVAELPQFVPAARLLGLLRAEQGRLLDARKVWWTALETCADDRELLRLLAVSSDERPVALPSVVATAPEPVRNRGMLWGTLAAAALIVVAAIYGFSRRQPVEVVAESAPVALDSRADSVALARTLGQVLAAESDSAVDVLRALEPHTRQWPAAARTRADAIAQQRGRAHFAAGEEAFDSGQWRVAVRDLSWAVTYGGGSDYHGRAMYLLARSHARASQPSSAKLQAQEVLRQYPKTSHDDAVMRAIATTGREP